MKLPDKPLPEYIVKRLDGQWVVLNSRAVVQFRSLKRANCTDWAKTNEPKAEYE